MPETDKPVQTGTTQNSPRPEPRPESNPGRPSTETKSDTRPHEGTRPKSDTK